MMGAIPGLVRCPPMRNTFLVVVSLLALGGCSRILGLEEDYVLREPITVRFNGALVTVPAGTHVRRYSFKEDVAFVAVYGETSFRGLDVAGGDTSE